MSLGRVPTLFVVIASLAFFASLSISTEAGNVSLKIVAIQTPKGVYLWMPDSILAKQGDIVTLKLINDLDEEHGYKIGAYGIEQIVGAGESKTISFQANQAGIFPITCHLHPTHVAGQLGVLK